jgi:hypothetical protein
MTQALQMGRYRGTHVTPIPCHQNPHDSMIRGWPTTAPTNFAHKKEQQDWPGRSASRLTPSGAD